MTNRIVIPAQAGIQRLSTHQRKIKDTGSPIGVGDDKKKQNNQQRSTLTFILSQKEEENALHLQEMAAEYSRLTTAHS